MTMHIHFLKDFEAFKLGDNKFVERALARRYCENGIAIPYQDYLERIEREKQEAKEKKAAELKAKKAAAAPKKEATAKRPRTRKKAVKK